MAATLERDADRPPVADRICGRHAVLWTSGRNCRCRAYEVAAFAVDDEPADDDALEEDDEDESDLAAEPEPESEPEPDEDSDEDSFELLEPFAPVEPEPARLSVR
jgi:hypothetical protein